MSKQASYADHARPPGILSLSPRVLQCEECGVTADAATVGLPETALKTAARAPTLRAALSRPLLA